MLAIARDPEGSRSPSFSKEVFRPDCACDLAARTMHQTDIRRAGSIEPSGWIEDISGE